MVKNDTATHTMIFSVQRLRCALVKLNHGIGARSWISISKFHINKCLDGKHGPTYNKLDLRVFLV